VYTRSKLSTIARADTRSSAPLDRHHHPIAVLLVIAYTIAFLIHDPLRRYTEMKMNRALKATPRESGSSTSIAGFLARISTTSCDRRTSPRPAAYVSSA